MRQFALPDGTRMWAPSAIELAVLYREIVTDRTYERHGVSVRAGDVVFDVGANIGLFAIHIARSVPGVRVHAFEPLPPLFAALTRNLEAHAPAVHAHNIGLAGFDGEAEFEFDPSLTMAATMEPRAVAAANRRAPASAWALAAIADLHRAQPSALTRLITSLPGPSTRRVAALAVSAPMSVLLGIRRRLSLQRHVCKLQTLARAVREAGVDRIDLLKIDVEGAEEAVVAGIDEESWPRIRQLVIEVHDADGRLERLRRLLDARGYATTSAREDWELHALLGLSTLYATRA